MYNKIFGSTCIVAGTTIGASMIALPMTSSSIGFKNSLILLLVMWVFMLCSAYLMVDISEGKGQSIAAIAGEKLGIFAKLVAAFTLMILFWALLAAYIAGASSILHKIFNIDQRLLGMLYVFIFGSIVVLKQVFVDYSNRALMIIKIVIFCVIGFALLPYVTFEQLMNSQPTKEVIDDVSFFKTMPIFFAAFGFHGSIPSLIQYLDGNRRAINLSLIFGSLIALIIYIVWQTMTLGVLNTTNLLNHINNQDVGSFIETVASVSHNPYVLSMIHLFTFLAITTSFLGVGLGMFNYVNEWFPDSNLLKFNNEKNIISKTAKNALLTFLIPIIFVFFYPSGFVFALGFAAMALSLFAVILPSCIAFKKVNNRSFFSSKFMASILLVGGIVIMVVELIGNN